eukprot:6213462-Pleurochrysis_carterae.AAC.1
MTIVRELLNHGAEVDEIAGARARLEPLTREERNAQCRLHVPHPVRECVRAQNKRAYLYRARRALQDVNGGIARNGSLCALYHARCGECVALNVCNRECASLRVRITTHVPADVPKQDV